MRSGADVGRVVGRAEAFEHRELRDALGKRARIKRRHRAAHRMPDDEQRRVRRELIRDAGDVRDVFWKVVVAARRRARRIAETA